MIARRDFVRGIGSAAALGACGMLSAAAKPKDRRLYGALLHLGMNMWNDHPIPRPVDANPRYPMPDWLSAEKREFQQMLERDKGWSDSMRFDESAWRVVTDRMGALGMNFVLLDLGEGLVYPSHPELAAKGAWTPDKMRSEIARLRAMGIEVFPKLNFSATHDLWLGKYARAVSTPGYYQAVSDVIRDVCEMFGHPRLFHIGYDEEDYLHQERFEYVVVRQGELWWHDFLYTIGEVEKNGARPWVWSDKIWHTREDYVKRCPRSVLQSNWYYLDDFNPPKDSELYPMVHAYEWLDEAGFDQVPCCSSCGQWYTLKTSARLTAEYAVKNISPERLKGLMSASWLATRTSRKEYLLDSLEQTVPARDILRL